MKCFNGFCQNGVVQAETVGEILQMMGLRVQKKALEDIIQEVDEDGTVIRITVTVANEFQVKYYPPLCAPRFG